MTKEAQVNTTFRYEEALGPQTPHIYSLWRHRNGNIYRVLMITNTSTNAPEDRYPATIIYQNKHNSTVWSRRLDDWHRSMTEIEE
jgi:hypothetical protein